MAKKIDQFICENPGKYNQNKLLMWAFMKIRPLTQDA